MRRASDFLEMMNGMFGEAARRGLMYRAAEDERFDGRLLHLDGRELVHFGSCSYLGLELDSRLKRGAVDAIERFGTQFSASRVFMSAPLYSQLEELLERVFGQPALIAPTTSLAHVAAFPVLIDEDDAVILDQQVHTSVRTAVNHVRVGGSLVEVVRHNRMDLLEERIRALRQTHRHVWYLADGVYSIFGDTAPMDDLLVLLERYPQFHVYVDDAHGMSWHGRYGRGVVLDRVPFHERLVVATSLNKAFAAGGSALLLPTAEWRLKVRTVGSSMVFSGPIQPANLGAAVASATLHLSPEFPAIQAELMTRIRHCNRLMREKGLPLVSDAEVPIRFLGTGSPEAAYALAEGLIRDGYFANVSVFPAVPMHQAGLRFTLTNHHATADIEGFVSSIARNLPAALAQAGLTLADVREEFGLPEPVLSGPAAPQELRIEVRPAKPSLTLEHHRTIRAISPAEWNSLLGDRGSYSHVGMRFLEAAFSGHAEPTSNWSFHYFIVRDEARRPVLATFFSDSLWKDDLIASEATSRLVEARRRADPSFLVSRTLGMGSQLTDGDHLYLDRTRDWQGALDLLLDAVAALRGEIGATTSVLRDLSPDDKELGDFLHNRGYVPFPMPESHVLTIDWADDEAYLAGLSKKTRQHVRQEMLPWVDAYDVEILRKGDRVPSAAEHAHFHKLYENVKGRSLALNTFDLPNGIFRDTLSFACWELMLFRLKPAFGGEPGALPVAVVACYVGDEHYVPMVIGLDYRYVESHRLYRQCLYRTMKRAQALAAHHVYYGIGAPMEKRRVGAKVDPRVIYVQTTDAFQLEVLAELMNDAASAVKQ